MRNSTKENQKEAKRIQARINVLVRDFIRLEKLVENCNNFIDSQAARRDETDDEELKRILEKNIQKSVDKKFEHKAALKEMGEELTQLENDIEGLKKVLGSNMPLPIALIHGVNVKTDSSVNNNEIILNTLYGCQRENKRAPETYADYQENVTEEKRRGGNEVWTRQANACLQSYYDPQVVAAKKARMDEAIELVDGEIVLVEVFPGTFEKFQILTISYRVSDPIHFLKVN